MNIAAGYYAVFQAIQGANIANEPWHFDMAAMAIGFAIVFDGLDGRVARMTNTTSDFGRELDSLADVITFGMAPAILAFLWGFHAHRDGERRTAYQEADSLRRGHDIPVPRGWRVPLGAIQYPEQSAAFEPRASGAKIFCGDADPRRGRRNRGGGALCPWISDPLVVDGADLVVVRACSSGS